MYRRLLLLIACAWLVLESGCKQEAPPTETKPRAGRLKRAPGVPGEAPKPDQGAPAP